MCVSGTICISSRLLPPPGAATTSALRLMSQKLCVIDVCNSTISVCTAGAPRHTNQVFIGALKDLGEMAERTGLEPATPGVTGRYSNQLNYRSR